MRRQNKASDRPATAKTLIYTLKLPLTKGEHCLVLPSSPCKQCSGAIMNISLAGENKAPVSRSTQLSPWSPWPSQMDARCLCVSQVLSRRLANLALAPPFRKPLHVHAFLFQRECVSMPPFEFSSNHTFLLIN